MKEDWEYKKLGEVVYYPTERIPSTEIDGSNYVGVDNLIKNRGGKETATIIPSEGNCIEYKAGDVLIGNIRPYLKKIWVADNNGGASGDVLILRANDEKILYSDYLYWCLSNDSFFEFDMLHSKGAKMPRGSKVDILKYTIPIPSISLQKEISSELEALNRVIKKQKAQLEEMDKLAQSVFYDMFGDPGTNEKGWTIRKIGDVCFLKSGNSDANNSDPGDLPYVKVSDMNILGNETFITLSSSYVDRAKNKIDIFPIGTTIFPKRGGAILTNKKRLTKVEICCDLNVMGVIPKMEYVNQYFIFYYFLNIDFKIFGQTGSTLPQINNHNIAPMKIGIPPLSLQQEFASKIEAIESMKAKVRQSLSEAKTLFNSRMDYYFN
ncbi:MAG: restriction endonuclease subunit S [Prevotella sp.]|nr:restriction endonuclease subunit S [Prevotella sp.]